jgi:HK97 family phage prohead protease
MKIDRKVVLLKEASVNGHGRLEGYGAVYGNIDDGGDELEAGSMAPAIPGFMSSGFVSWGHDWEVPVAYPKAASEDSHGLYLDAQFHSTAAAQEKRTITKERLDAGLTMGLSIGYGDVKAERTPEKRLIKSVGRLYEIGLVMVPMNAAAGVAGVKAATADCPTCDGSGKIMQGNRKCPDCNGTGSVMKGLKAAADNVSSATYVLSTLNELIESESMDAQEDGDTTDAAEVDALVRARDSLLEFIAAESAEVGTADDLEDVAEENAARAALASSYGWMGRNRVPYATHIASVEAGLKALVARSRAVSRLRKEGRVLSSANRSRLGELATALAAGEADIRDLLASTDTGKAARAAEIEYLLAQAADLGVEFATV